MTATESVQLIGISPDGQPITGLLTQAVGVAGAGAAGDLTIASGELIVQDGAQVNVSSEGTGDAGNLEVAVRSIQLDNKGKLTAETAAGNGGNITLRNPDLLLMRRNSEISTSAGSAGAGGDGGNIDIIDAKFTVALPSENSDITANAFTGRGGRVQITAQGIFGLVPRSLEEIKTLLGTENPNQLDPTRLPSSDITAISQTNPSLSGQVTLNTPEVDPSRGLVNLPAQPTDTEVAQACQPGGSQAQSEFVVTGRGGLPPNPSEVLSSDAIEVDWVTLNPGVENSSNPTASNQLTAPEPAPIVEAQGWVYGPNGEVILTEKAPTVTPHSPWRTPATCRAAQLSISSRNYCC